MTGTGQFQRKAQLWIFLQMIGWNDVKTKLELTIIESVQATAQIFTAGDSSIGISKVWFKQIIQKHITRKYKEQQL